MYFCVVLCIVCFVTFPVLFVCICVLNYCHRVATPLQLNISYHISNVKYVNCEVNVRDFSFIGKTEEGQNVLDNFVCYEITRSRNDMQ
jgi:hypothetical protein